VTIELTTKEYAKEAGIAHSTVTRTLREGRKLAAVKKVKRVYQYYRLICDKAQLEKLKPL